MIYEIREIYVSTGQLYTHRQMNQSMAKNKEEALCTH